jgi:hypothetical protein
MYRLYLLPATRFVCRHCGGDAGDDPELCVRCGPICERCHAEDQYPCEPRQVTLPPRLTREQNKYGGA